MTTKLAIILVLFVAASSCAVLQGYARPMQSQEEEGQVVAAAAAAAVDDSKDCSYAIISKTGDRHGAETQSEITFTFWDKANNTFKKSLDGYKDKAFRRGKKDWIDFDAKCMKPCRLMITIDISGARWEGAWYCEYVKLIVIDSHNLQVKLDDTFKVQEWFGIINKRKLTIDHCGGSSLSSSSSVEVEDRRLPSFMSVV